MSPDGSTASNLGTSSTGMQPNVAAALSYLLGILTGIIFFVIEKDNRFVKFHAMQSILVWVAVFVAYIVLMFIPIIGWIIALFLWIGVLALWLFLMWKAYKGEWYKLPMLGDIAEKNTQS